MLHSRQPICKWCGSCLLPKATENPPRKSKQSMGSWNLWKHAWKIGPGAPCSLVSLASHHDPHHNMWCSDFWCTNFGLKFAESWFHKLIGNVKHDHEDQETDRTPIGTGHCATKEYCQLPALPSAAMSFALLRNCLISSFDCHRKERWL